MKKVALILAVFGMTAGSIGYAQPAGKGASAAKNSANDDFAWGIGLAGVAVLATVVGVIVASATDSACSYNHH